MVIGFDASRAFVGQRTGTENYSYQLLKALAKIDRKNRYRVYLRPDVIARSSSSVIPAKAGIQVSMDPRVKPEDDKREDTNLASQGRALQGWPANFKFKVISWPRFWTQGGLALECLINPPDVLFIPAHTLPAIAVTLRRLQAGLPVIRRPGLKTVVTIHDLGAEYLLQYHQTPQKYYLNWSTKYVVKHATRIIAVSKSTKQALISKLQCDIEIIRVIYEGVNSEELRVKSLGQDSGDILKKYGIQKPYILFVGTIQPRKNLARLIEAFSLLCHPDPSADGEGSLANAIALVLVGKPGWLYKDIYDAPKRFGVKDNIKFLNFVPDEDLAILYKEAEVFCLPSLYEGFGLPVLEAMAAGVPVVASNTSSLPEVVGQAGILVDPLDVNSIAQGLHWVLTDRKFREKLVRKGKERVKQFRWEKTARETVKVLEEVYEQA